MSGRWQARTRARGERGAIGGIEMLPLGVLVFVGGLLLVANLWAVIDGHLMAAAAARQAVRAYVEADDGVSATAAGQEAARRSAQAYGVDPDAVTVGWDDGGQSFGRCTRIVADVDYEVRAFILGPVGTFGIHASASEVVDPHRDGLTGAGCGA